MNRVRILAALGLLIAAGCGGDGKQIVEGTVTLDNAPLASGDIEFVPEDPKFGTEAGKIEKGAFKFKAREGKAKVVIRATRVVPDKKGPMGTEDVLESIVPAQYNDKTTLTAEVAPGKTKFEFPLKSK